MKQKRPGRVDRRRPLVEMNLMSERAKTRQKAGLRGCIPPLGVLVVAAGFVMAKAVGLR